MITANSFLARAVVVARELIAASPTFIARHGKYANPEDGTEPIERVYLYAADIQDLAVETLKELRPFAVVGVTDDIKWEKIHPGCAHTNLKVSGQVYAILVDDARETDVPQLDDNNNVGDGSSHPNDSYIDFLNFCGVMDEMSPHSETEPFKGFASELDSLGFYGIEIVEVPMRTSVDDRETDDAWSVGFTFKFGDGE